MEPTGKLDVQTAPQRIPAGELVTLLPPRAATPLIVSRRTAGESATDASRR